jgi:predicted deacetylase
VLAAVREVADIPLTLLVVPAYWGQCSALDRDFAKAMTQRLEGGDELVLHGYFHQDLGVPHSALDWLRRRIYTAAEGEFCALSEQEAAERLLLGLRWFDSNHWPVAGFVPPAWLLGADAWKALRGFRQLEYVTTFAAIHAVHGTMSWRAPCLTFSARAPWRRMLSCAWATVGFRHSTAEVLRVALHPRDADFPGLRRAWQSRLAALLKERVPVTKAQFVRTALQRRSLEATRASPFTLETPL